MLVAFIGAANSIEDVAGFTLLQRIVDDSVLTRVLGAVWGLAAAGLAIGSLATSALLAVVGDKAALVIVGAFLPVSTLIAWARLTALDRTAMAPAQLDADRRSADVRAAADRDEGAAGAPARAPRGAGRGRSSCGRGLGDRFYIVGEGELVVAVGRRGAADSGAGDYFGEIALLRDVPRTATVRDGHAGVLFALARRLPRRRDGARGGPRRRRARRRERLQRSVPGELADDDLLLGHAGRLQQVADGLGHRGRARHEVGVGGESARRGGRGASARRCGASRPPSPARRS